MTRKPFVRDYTRVFLLVWWIAHFTRFLYFSDTSSSTSAVSEGDLFNQVEFLSLFGVGLYYFRGAWQRLKVSRGFWFTALAWYIGWSCLTVAWSIDPSLSIRRLLLFLIELVAWIGIGAGYYGGSDGPTRLCRDFRYVCVAMIAMGVPIFGPELTPTNLLNPYWESALRSMGSDVIEASVFGLLACIASVYRPNNGRFWKLRLFVFPALAILFFMLIMKGRSAIAMTVIILGFSGLRLIKHRIGRTAARILISLALLFTIANVSTNILQQTALGEFLARGNDSHTIESLNGRTPLWEYIISEIELHPLQGVGFGAYWSAERMEIVWSRFRWHAPVAHNGYLDESVQTGLIGMGLILMFLMGTVVRLWKLGKEYPAATTGIYWIYLFLLLNLTDSYFQNFRRITVIACMLMVFSCLGAVEAKSRSRRYGNSVADLTLEPSGDVSVEIPPQPGKPGRMRGPATVVE